MYGLRYGTNAAGHERLPWGEFQSQCTPGAMPCHAILLQHGQEIHTCLAFTLAMVYNTYPQQSWPGCPSFQMAVMIATDMQMLCQSLWCAMPCGTTSMLCTTATTATTHTRLYYPLPPLPPRIHACITHCHHADNSVTEADVGLIPYSW